MKITTPTATLGIRGTTGLVEVPEGAAANNPNNVAVKLYPDADGRVGRIEVNDRAGARLGFLTQGASGFTIRPGAGGARFAAVPLVIPQAVMLRDQGFVRQLHSTQNVGRQLVFQQREFRRANPGFVNPNRPIRQLQPGQQRPNGLPGQRRTNRTAARTTRSAATAECAEPPGQQQPGQLNRPGQQQPGQLNRPGQPQQPGAPNRQGQQQPGSPSDRACRRAPDSRSSPARPINPACHRVRDNRHDPICRRSPACRRAQDNRNSPPCRRSPPRRRHGQDCRTGSAFRDCSACPAFRERPPCNVRDCPPRRGGLRPRRNAASRRRSSASRKMESGIAPQPVAQLLQEASRPLSRSTLHRVDGHRLYLQRK